MVPDQDTRDGGHCVEHTGDHGRLLRSLQANTKRPQIHQNSKSSLTVFGTSPNSLVDHLSELVITAVILAPGARGREGPSRSSWDQSGGSGGSGGVFQTRVSFEAVLKNSPLEPPRMEIEALGGAGRALGGPGAALGGSGGALGQPRGAK